MAEEQYQIDYDNSKADYFIYVIHDIIISDDFISQIQSNAPTPLIPFEYAQYNGSELIKNLNDKINKAENFAESAKNGLKYLVEHKPFKKAFNRKTYTEANGQYPLMELRKIKSELENLNKRIKSYGK